MSDTPLTLRGAVKLVGEKLAIVGIEQPFAEARRLIGEALEIDSVELIRNPEKMLSTSQGNAVQHWLRRRSCGEPLARIRGWQEFYGRRFELSEATLEPRADTETLIDAVLAKVDESYGRYYPWRILDIGTGTGCIAITLLAELPQARAVARNGQRMGWPITGPRARSPARASMGRFRAGVIGEQWWCTAAASAPHLG